MRPVPQIALDFIKGAEGLRLSAYRDSGGKPTIGYGHTSPSVVMGLSISQAQADSFLFADATQAATRIALCVQADRIAALSEHQWAALISFSLNVGFSQAECPTLIRLLNTGQTDAAPKAMMQFDHVRINGVLVENAGLINRRTAERTLWGTADVGAAIAVAQAVPDVMPSSQTRALDTPAVGLPTKALMDSKRFVTACATTCVTTAAAFAQPAKDAIDQVRGAITPYAGDSAILQNLSSHLAMVGAGLAAATALFVLWQHHQDAKQ